MGDAPDPRSFYAEQLPEQWNRALLEQERLVESSRRELEGMRAVNATIAVEVRGEVSTTFHLNVSEGVMSADDAPAHTPFLTVVQDRVGFENLAREAGDSALSMLGALTGLAGELKLTEARVKLLAGIRGCLRFEVTGAQGFSLLTRFGDGAMPEEPDTTIRVAPETYAELRAGRLDPQNAFMGGQIQVEGDMQLAMNLALAALSPD
ncbi:MAG: SCP2 sterol-binding domain-containing protein [Myxococcota bacterium]